MDNKISTLTFGVELELHLAAGTSVREACRLVSEAIQKPCVVQDYNHAVSNGWKAVMDGSLDGANSWEFVSPVLQGDAGLNELRLVLETLTAFGATVGRDCGTHVHIGVGSLEPDVNWLKRMVKAYMIFEHAIDSVMPQSRRDSNTHFVRTMTHFRVDEIDAARTVRDLINNALHRDRYRKFNVCPLVRPGSPQPTVEFRQHGGTLEFPKLSNWILFCLRFVAACRDGSIAVPTTENGTTQTNQARYGSKSYQIGQLLLRPEGCTAPEAMAAVGWPSVSMVQQARICGLALTRERRGRSMRFYARSFSQAAATTMASGPATLERLLEIIDASAEERSYFADRRAHFAGLRQAA